MTHAAHQLLQDARALIADPKNWTQGAYARDKDGINVGTSSPQAVCFCGNGALMHAHAMAEPGLGYQAAWDAMDALGCTARRVHGLAVESVNDRLGHPAVLALYDLAMERVRPA